MHRCCGDQEHVSNLGSDDYEDNLFKGIDNLRETAKGYVRSCGVPNIKIRNTLQLMTSLPGHPSTSAEHRAAVKPLWGSDPVHPNRILFDALAANLLEDHKPEAKPASSDFKLPRSCLWLSDGDWQAQRPHSSRGRGRSNPRHRPY
jgi:hypothetical protein